MSVGGTVWELRGRADSDELSSLQADVPALVHHPSAGL